MQKKTEVQESKNMKENTEEKSLVQVNRNGIFNKIKMFFKNLFSKNNVIDNNCYTIEDEKNNENIKNLLWNLLEILKMKK